MDELFNQLNSPAFWFTNFIFAIIVAIIANRLDKQIPALSLKWLEVLIYLYAIFGTAMTLYAYFIGGYFPYRKPDDTLHDALEDYLFFYILKKYNYLIIVILMGFLFPMLMIYVTRTIASFHKTATIAIGIASLISITLALYELVINKGWTKDAYSLFILSASLVGLVSCFFFIAPILFDKREPGG